MATRENRFSRAFSFVLDNGTEVFPVRMKRRDNGALAFRTSRGGAGGNTLESTQEVDEATMIRNALDLREPCAALLSTARPMVSTGWMDGPCGKSGAGGCDWAREFLCSAC